ncbi:MAG: HD domain-containing protein [Candidatus Aenigmatarchaeota archaeon]|nr:HD domain-containing protein [Nanoarchaeota archaeon]
MFQYTRNGLYTMLHPEETEEMFRRVTRDQRNGEVWDMMKHHDTITYEHEGSVSLICTDIGFDTGLPEERIYDLATAALLHDTGKLGVDGEILNKPEKLSREEWERMKLHPRYGVAKLKEFGYSADVLEIVGSHHEWKEGPYMRSGQDRRKCSRFTENDRISDRRHVVRNQQLVNIGGVEFVNLPDSEMYSEGEMISLFSKIVATEDVLDAFCGNRSYMDDSLSIEEIARIMRNELKVEERIIRNVLMRYSNSETYASVA